MSFTFTELLSGVGDMWQRMSPDNSLNHFRLENWVLYHSKGEKAGQALPSMYERGTPKECFKNAGQHALWNNSLTYCEGFAISKRLGIPIHHAWLVDGDGGVIDTTWSDPEECTYLGVEFPTSFLKRWTFKNKYWGLLSSDWGVNVDVMKDFERVTGQ
ncbi:hypothetical protein UFOVP28_12 [uncultured Caudovirales phage]|uniref:Uncharacterized protein n=1 Tax=uncultured Caudovirales phage TaxID=2100421 RepID=A0A6J5KK37_9CAUD|nr:hypothetical protein UFOVP28_12 [uncultured Caudovirales phage]